LYDLLLRVSEPVFHVPVLLDEVMALLNLRRGATCVDATVDGGGHARAMLAAIGPQGRLLGIDRDPEMLTSLRVRLDEEVRSGRLFLVTASFRELGRVLSEHHFEAVDAVLFDFGVSSHHLDLSGRGFSFTRDEPLDMRFDPKDKSRETAADILATRTAHELTSLFRSYGEEHFASRIARTIVARRAEEPIRGTGQLLELIQLSLPPKVRWRAARSAARVFQALRIAVNDELGAIGEALPQALAALVPGGRLAAISFHSLEDRIVKNFLREEQRAGHLRTLTKKPITPSEAEIEVNPRAASAKLRAGEKT
jgi:16S rRNA (cytosine1402-N4)-methyltransferase